MKLEKIKQKIDSFNIEYMGNLKIYKENMSNCILTLDSNTLYSLALNHILNSFTVKNIFAEHDKLFIMIHMNL